MRASVPFLVISLSLGVLQGESAEDLVDKLQEHYLQVRSFSADFEQIFTSPLAELRESGRLLMEKPGKMYWEYRDPISKVFVADGRKSYFYVPEESQVIISDLDLENARTPLLFLLGKGEIRQEFFIEPELEEQPREQENKLVRLTPKEPQGEFTHVILEVNGQDLFIRRLIVVEPIGNRNEYVLSNLKVNISIPEKQFRFTVPENVEVVSQ